MKVLMINGSPHADGCTARALTEVGNTLKSKNIDYEILQVGHLAIKGCNGCGGCAKLKKCVTDDVVNIALEKMKECDGLIIGSPVYFASANGTLISFLDRLFSAAKGSFAHKVGAAVVSARRAGNTATFDELNKYFLISNMFIVGSNYWNNVHGNKKEEVEQDLEGLQTMRTLGLNMAYLMECIAKSDVQKPVLETKIKTNFTR